MNAPWRFCNHAEVQWNNIRNSLKNETVDHQYRYNIRKIALSCLEQKVSYIESQNIWINARSSRRQHARFDSKGNVYTSFENGCRNIIFLLVSYMSTS
jgi:hypothetical protein